MANINGTGASDIIRPSGNSAGVTGGSPTASADSILGIAGDDSIEGGGGNDTLDGGDGNDSLFGQDGDDFISPGTGNDSIVGGAGFNTLNYSNSTMPIAFSISNGAGTATSAQIGTDSFSDMDAWRGGSGADTFTISSYDPTVGSYLRMRGNGGNDTLIGLLDAGWRNQADFGSAIGVVSVNLGASGSAVDGMGGTDTLTHIYSVRAGEFNDTLNGSAGYNEFDPGRGNDIINGGGGGRDSVRYDSWINMLPTQGITANLEAGSVIDPWGNFDTLTGINRIIGSGFADVIIGSTQSNRIAGRAGNDSIDGSLGYDYALYSSSGSGVVVNLTTGFALDGEGGTDTLISMEGVFGSSFADDLTGATVLGTSISWLRGGAGNDTLRAADGALTGASFADQRQGMTVNLANGTVTDSFLGTDTLINIRGAEMFGNFNDTLIGTAGDDVFSPDDGFDIVDGAGGSDWVNYGGTDAAVTVNLILGFALDGAGQNDILTSIENVQGSSYADTLTGNAGNNIIAPGGGQDMVDAGGGTDTLDYGAFSSLGAVWSAVWGRDVDTWYVLQGVSVDLLTQRAIDIAGNTDTVLGFENVFGVDTRGDTIAGDTFGNVIDGRGGSDVLTGRDDNDTLLGGAGNDTLNGNSGNDSSQGGTGDDQLFGEDGDDQMNGNSGHDLLAGGWGHDSLFGEDENDVLFGEGGNDLLVMGIGDDRGYGQDGDDVLFGEAGQDLIVSGWGNDTAYGQGANDQVFGEGGNDVLFGGDADDGVYGQIGDDQVNGEAGNDVVNGGDGQDTLSGGNGADIFFFDRPNGGTDFIMDFNRAEGDKLYVAAAQFAAPAGFQLTQGVGFHSGAGAAPTAATATFYRDTSSQALWFDADGTGPGGPHVMAFLIGNPTLTASDIVFV